MSAPAHVLAPDFDRMPAELRQLPRWVVWKGAKVPYCAASVNGKASSTDPGTWASFEQAQTAYTEGGYSGVGFVLNGDGLVGVDLDKCVEDGEPLPAAIALLDGLGCAYVELSPSGTGLRGFGYGGGVDGRRGNLDGLSIELYATKRYLTVTGRTLRSGPLVPLPGFAALAESIRPAGLQKRTEEDLCNLLSSSVRFPAFLIPKRPGERHAHVFKLARYLRGTQAEATRAELRALVQEWHALALPFIGTKDFLVTWDDFLRAWEGVRQPYGQTMHNILNSIDYAEPLPAVEGLGYGPEGLHLVRVCMALQAHQGDEPFFLSVRQAGEVIGVNHTDAAKMLSALVGDGVLQLVSKGAGLKASRYKMP